MRKGWGVVAHLITRERNNGGGDGPRDNDGNDSDEDYGAVDGDNDMMKVMMRMVMTVIMLMKGRLRCCLIEACSP